MTTARRSVWDAEGVPIFTRRRLDWTAQYRDLAKAAAESGAPLAGVKYERNLMFALRFIA